MIGVTRLMQLFPFGGISQAVIDRYNHQANEELEKIRDFIILHYKVTERTDSTFWDQVRTMDIPDSLAHRIALFQESAQVFQAPGELFQVDSWLQVMLGQRIMPKTYHHMGRLMPPQQLKQALEQQWAVRSGTETFLHLGISDGLTYSYSPSAPLGSRIVASTLKLDGVCRGGKSLKVSAHFAATKFMVNAM